MTRDELAEKIDKSTNHKLSNVELYSLAGQISTVYHDSVIDECIQTIELNCKTGDCVQWILSKLDDLKSKGG